MPGDFNKADFHNKDYDREFHYNTTVEAAKAVQHRDSMYPEQAAAFDDIVAHVEAARPGFFFIDGPGGSGKTYLYEAILHHVRGQGGVALACAWSGIAATLLEGGRTCHSRFGLPVPLPRDAVTSCIKSQSARAKALREARVIVWDEGPMAPKEALEACDSLLRDLMDSDDIFGGKIVVLGGDFRQVLPVIPHSSRDDVVSHSIKAHPLWLQGFVHIHRLRLNKRAESDAPWSDFLLQLGDGLLETHEDVSAFAVRLPDEICAPYGSTVDDLVEHIFPNLAEEAARCVSGGGLTEHLEYFRERAILTPTNAVADEWNAAILQSLDPGTHVTYTSSDSIDAATDQDNVLWPMDFLNSLTPSGMPPHELTLAPGALIMLLRNIDVDEGLCNGVRGIVVQTMPRVLDVLIVSGSATGKRVYIPRMVLAPKNPDLPFVLRRRQFPVKLAWAMTINKAQEGIFMLKMLTSVRSHDSLPSPSSP